MSILRAIIIGASPRWKHRGLLLSLKRLSRGAKGKASRCAGEDETLRKKSRTDGKMMGVEAIKKTKKDGEALWQTV